MVPSSFAGFTNLSLSRFPYGLANENQESSLVSANKLNLGLSLFFLDQYSEENSDSISSEQVKKLWVYIKGTILCST